MVAYSDKIIVPKTEGTNLFKFVELGRKSYPGGKGSSGVPQKIISQVPKHTTYVTGFLGMDYIRRVMLPSKMSVGFELDQDVVKLWKEAKYTTKHFTKKNLKIYNDSFFNIEQYLKLYKDIFLYLDPPYPLMSRSSGECYKHELTDEQHYMICKMINKFSFPVAISTYPNKIYRKELKGWRYIDYMTNTRGGVKKERLYMNYPQPKILHDFRFIETSAKRRSRAWMKIDSLIGKIDNLPELYRNALLNEIAQKYGAELASIAKYNVEIN